VDGWSPNETAPRTATREAKEETGLDVHVRELVGEYRVIHQDTGETHVSVFTADILGGELRPNPGEIDDLMWAAPEALPTPLTTSAPRAIADAVAGVRGARRFLAAPQPSG
jgi:8-oxo-dGTP pyrophosphatase MutT (NUDIX family)